MERVTQGIYPNSAYNSHEGVGGVATLGLKSIPKSPDTGLFVIMIPVHRMIHRLIYRPSLSILSVYLRHFCNTVLRNERPGLEQALPV